MDSCYVIAFYLGPRRRKFPNYKQDRLCYLKKQIETLTTVKHSLNKIYFVFSVETDHYDLLNKALNIIPKTIQGTEVKVIIRENIGFSYGAWSNIMDKTNHDYYIFNEDDYFFIEDGWDSYMINNFKKKPNCGGFGIHVGFATALGHSPNFIDNRGEHFAHSAFCTSKEVIQDIKTNYNGFNYVENADYTSNERHQITFSHILIEAGYRLYDIREDYDLYFSMTDGESQASNGLKIMKIINHDPEKHLIVSDTIAFGLAYNWWLPHDGCFRLEERMRAEFPHFNPEVRKNDT